MDNDPTDGIFTDVLTYLAGAMPGNSFGMMIMGWLGTSWLARFVLTKWQPPKPGTRLAMLHLFLAYYAQSYGWASMAYQVGRHAIMVPVAASRENASIKLGFDPKTTSAKVRALPKPLSGGIDEADAITPEQALKTAQDTIAQYKDNIHGFGPIPKGDLAHALKNPDTIKKPEA